MPGKIKHGEAEASNATESRSFPKEKKLKLMPTLLEKKHYLVLTAEQDAEEAINKAILDFVGVLGYAKACVFLVEKEKVGNNSFYFILAVATKHVNAVRAAIALIKGVKCIGVSGTIKKAREKFLSSLTA